MCTSVDECAKIAESGLKSQFESPIQIFPTSALGEWGRMQMTGFDLFSPVGVSLVPLKTHDFKGFRPNFNQSLTRL